MEEKQRAYTENLLNDPASTLTPEDPDADGGSDDQQISGDDTEEADDDYASESEGDADSDDGASGHDEQANPTPVPNIR